MTVESKQLLPKVANDLHLLEQYAVQAPNVDLHVAAWLVNLVEERHFVLDHAHDFVDVPPVRMDQLLLLLEDLLDELLVVRAQLLHTVPVLTLQLTLRLHMGVQRVQLDDFLRLWL